MAVPGNGNVYVTGALYPRTPIYEDYGTIAYNVLTGARLWVKTSNGPGNRHDNAASVAATRNRSSSPDTATGNTTTNADYATIAYKS